MMGHMRTSFDEDLKKTEPLPMPKVTPPSDILDALEDSDILKTYGKLTVNERLFEELASLAGCYQWLASTPTRYPESIPS
jgi:hypothetical protein